MPWTTFHISLSATMAHASLVWSLLNLLGRMILSTNWSAPNIKPQMARLKVQLKLLKLDWDGCQVEHWKQSFHGSYSPTGQHPYHNWSYTCRTADEKEVKKQIWTGWHHPPLPQYSSAKIIRYSIMTELWRYECFTKAGKFLPRLLQKLWRDG